MQLKNVLYFPCRCWKKSTSSFSRSLAIHLTMINTIFKWLLSGHLEKLDRTPSHDLGMTVSSTITHHMQCIWRRVNRSMVPSPSYRDLKQARTATAVNKQLKFRETTDNWQRLRIAYLKHILWLKVCERTVLTILKSILSNTFHRGEGCRRHEDVNLLDVGKRYSRMTSKQSMQFFHTLLIIKCTSNMQYI